MTDTLASGLDLQLESDFLTIFADGFAPALLRLQALPQGDPEGSITIILEPVAPITVKVSDSNGIPIPGGRAFLWYEPEDLDAWRLGEEPLWAKLRIQFALLHADIDAAGVCTFKAPFQSGNRIEVRSGGTYLNGAFPGVVDGAELQHIALEGLSISGSVRDQNGIPIAGAGVAAYADAISSETRSISKTTQEDGSFLLEGVPADAQRLIVTAEMAGFANAQTTWLDAQIGDVLQAEMTLTPGVGCILQIQTPNAEAIGPAWVWLERELGEGLTYGSEVDITGKVVLPPAYLGGEDYQVTLRLGGVTWLLPGRIQPDREQVLEVRDVMRFAALDEIPDTGRKLAELRWIPERPDVTGSTSWAPDDISPLLVSGSGVLEYLFEDYSLEVVRGDFPYGQVHPLPTPEVSTTQIRFSFEAGLDVAWELLTQDGFLVASAISDTAVVQVPCHPGTYRFIFWDDDSIIDRSFLWVGENGLDLGTLGFSQQSEGGVFGQVLHSDGSPWPGFAVTAKLPADLTILEVETDQDGEFYFAGLPPGTILLEGFGQASFGIPGVDFTRMIEILPGADIGPVILEMDLKNRLLGKLGWTEPGNANAFLIHGKLDRTRVNAAGNFELPVPAGAALVGATIAEPHGLFAYLQPLLSGDKGCTLRKDTGLRRMQLRDGSGNGLPWVRVRLQVGDFLLPGHTFSDSAGILDLGLPEIAGLKCLFFRSGYPTVVLPAGELPLGETVVLPNAVLDRPLIFPEENGTPRMDVTVIGDAGFDRFGPNADGVILVPTSGADFLRAVSPRTFPVSLLGGRSGSVVLPQRLTGFRVTADKYIASLRFMSTADGFPTCIVQGELNKEEDGTFHLPEFPTGTVTLQGFDQDGQLILTSTQHVDPAAAPLLTLGS